MIILYSKIIDIWLDLMELFENVTGFHVFEPQYVFHHCGEEFD